MIVYDDFSLKKSLGVPGSLAGFDGHGNDGIVDINDVELTLAPTYFGSERVSESSAPHSKLLLGSMQPI